MAQNIPDLQPLVDAVQKAAAGAAETIRDGNVKVAEALLSVGETLGDLKAATTGATAVSPETRAAIRAFEDIQRSRNFLARTAAISNLQARALDAKRIELTWEFPKAFEASVQSFVIERRIAGGGAAEVAKPGAEARQYVDQQNLHLSTEYEYRIELITAHGRYSGPDPVRVTTPA